MKRLLFTILLVTQVFLGFSQKLPSRPSPPKLVNDYTNTLAPDQQAALERKLVAYDDSTSNQVVVVILPTIGDYELADYATKLGRAWGVGNKKTNNGVVVLVVQDSREVFIAPGYGLEGALPDITCKAIIDNEIVPNFRQQDFYRGLDLGTTAIFKAAAGEYKAPQGYRNRGSSGRGSGSGSIIGIIIIIIIVLMLIGRGGGRGGGGGMYSRRGGGFIEGAILGSLLGGGGRGGGDWGGGGGFSGGDSGGGFGGFGGGSFGGGGSGGSW